MKPEAVLDGFLSDIQAGRSSLDECLARHPNGNGELESLLLLALRVREHAEPIAASPAFKAQTRAWLMREIRLDQARATGPGRTPVTGRVLGALWPRWLGRLAPAGAMVALCLVVAALGGGVAYAARDALPGESLYGVKLAFEQVQAAVVAGDVQKAELYVDFADRRLEEAVRLAERGRATEIELAVESYGREMERAAAVVASRAAAGTADAGAAGERLPEVVAERKARQREVLERVLVQAPESAQPALAQALDRTRRQGESPVVAPAPPAVPVAPPTAGATEFKVEGTLTAINQDGSLVVNGLRVERSPATKVEGDLAVGSAVAVKGSIGPGGTLVAAAVEVEKKDEGARSRTGEKGEVDKAGGEKDSTEGAGRDQGGSDKGTGDDRVGGDKGAGNGVDQSSGDKGGADQSSADKGGSGKDADKGGTDKDVDKGGSDKGGGDKSGSDKVSGDKDVDKGSGGKDADKGGSDKDVDKGGADKGGGDTSGSDKVSNDKDVDKGGSGKDADKGSSDKDVDKGGGDKGGSDRGSGDKGGGDKGGGDKGGSDKGSGDKDADKGGADKGGGDKGGADKGGGDKGGGDKGGADKGGGDKGGADKGGSDKGGSDKGGSDKGGSDRGGSDKGGGDKGGGDKGGGDKGGADKGGGDKGGADKGGDKGGSDKGGGDKGGGDKGGADKGGGDKGGGDKGGGDKGGGGGGKK